MSERVVLSGIWKPRPLPVEQWLVGFEGGCIVVAAHVNGPDPGCLFWTRIELSDFPQDDIGLGDLKGAFIEAVDARIAAKQSVAPRAVGEGLSA